jgi:hypothetical protein
MAYFLKAKAVPSSQGIHSSLTSFTWMGYLTVILVLCLSGPLSGLALEFRTITTPHLAFSFHPHDEKLIKPLIDDAEGLRREILNDLGFEFKGITRVYLAPSFKDFQEVQPGGKIQPWAIGVAYPRMNLIVLLSPKAIKRGHIDLRTIFAHEFSHLALGRAFQGSEGAPQWLHEGLAMYESREWDFRRVSTITRAVLTNSLIPLSEITQSFPRERGRAELSYSESFYLVSFLINKYGRSPFHRFIREYSGGKPLNQVLVDTYGMGLDQLEKRWRGYLKMRFSWIPIITSSTALWFLFTLIFLLAYGKKRREERQLYEQWEREELDI